MVSLNALIYELTDVGLKTKLLALLGQSNVVNESALFFKEDKPVAAEQVKLIKLFTEICKEANNWSQLLRLACRREQVEIVRFLLLIYPDDTARQEILKADSHYIFREQGYYGNAAIAELLFLAYTDDASRQEAFAAESHEGLRRACEYGHFELVQLLLRNMSMMKFGKRH